MWWRRDRVLSNTSAFLGVANSITLGRLSLLILGTLFYEHINLVVYGSIVLLVVIADGFDGGRFEQLLAEYANHHDVPKIMSNSRLSEVAKEITMLWYMSGFRIPGCQGDDGEPEFKELAPETPEQYFRALFWPTVRAHPLGLSGGYFGYWKYPPEN